MVYTTDSHTVGSSMDWQFLNLIFQYLYPLQKADGMLASYQLIVYKLFTK